MCSYLTQGSPHKYSSNLITNQKLGDVVRVSPHYSKLLCSPVTIKLSDAVRIANRHNIKDTIESRTDTLTILIPDFEKLLPFTVHDHTTSIGKNTLHEEILIQK